MPVKAVAQTRVMPRPRTSSGETMPSAAILPEKAKNASVRGFKYAGTDANGRLLKNVRVPFQTLEEAKVRLRTAGINVTGIAPVSEMFAFLDYKKNSKPSVTDMASLADQIAAQYTTGLSYDKICRILGRVHPKAQIRTALNSVAELIANGRPAYEAFGAQLDKKGNPFFPPTFVYAFQIGEKIGALPDPETGVSGDAPVIMLRFFAKAQRQAAAIAKSIVKGLISPASILISCLVVFFIQVYFIVPQFATIFVGLLNGKDASLPLPTQIMLDISDFFYAPSGIIFALAVFVSLFGGVYYFFFNDRGIEKRGRLVLTLPVLRSFFLPYNASIFCRNLCIMYAETDVTSRFQTIAVTTVNPAFRELAEHCREQLIVNAVPFNDLFSGHLHLLGDAFLPVAETIEANPGQAQQLLFTYAKFLEEEAEEKLAISITTLNKSVFILAALITAFILIASYAPLISLVGRLSGGGK